MAVYGVSLAAYVGFVFYGYRTGHGQFFVVGWTFVAAAATALLIVWFMLVNLFYLLMQIAIAVESLGIVDAAGAALRFARAERR